MRLNTGKLKYLLYLPLVVLLLALNVFSANLFSANAYEFVITGNGDGSSNEITAEVVQETVVVQSNDANISNEVDASADTGGNEASQNNGDVSIETGDIQAAVEIENSANTSVVDIGECCPDDTSVVVSNNGSGSSSNVNLSTSDTTNVQINQVANIDNSVSGAANTGENKANNKSGNVEIDTGSIYAISNIINGPVNLHSVSVGGDGISTQVKVSGNAADSINKVVSNLNFSNNVFVNNLFNLRNNINWDLNSGKNNANGNLGDISIKTGDITLISLIENIGNIGKVNIEGCCQGGPVDPPVEPPIDPPIDPPVEPPGPPVNGDNGDDGGGGGNGGVVIAAAAGPGIMGLSDTSSLGAQALFFWAGVIFLAIGSTLVGKQVFSKP